MELVITEEQEALVEAVRQWLDATSALEGARSGDPGRSRIRREGLGAAAAMGLLSLLRSGEGGTHADLALVVEEVGRAATPLPIGQSALVCRALDDVGIAADTTAGIAEGKVIAVPAQPEPGEERVAGLEQADGTLSLSGRVPLVLGGLAAELFLVPAVAADGSHMLALVPAGADGVSRTARTTLDLTRDFASVVLDGVRVPSGSWAKTAEDVVEAIADAVALHHAADAVGAADRLLEMTVQYVQERQQFGRAIGSFQAVKHHCATMALDVECARITVRVAAQTLDSADRVARRTQVSSATSFAGEACSRVAGTALQLHGGMGFTWEHDLHLLLRRVKTGELLGGSPRHHRARLFDLVA
jgi:alkylation response protein AidB-like acyl-CoA dehydrogenase